MIFLINVLMALLGFACGAVFIHGLGGYFHTNSLTSLTHASMGLYYLVLIACYSSK